MTARFVYFVPVLSVLLHRKDEWSCQAADDDTDSSQLRLQVAGGADAAGFMVIWYRSTYKGYFHRNFFALMCFF